MLESFDVFISYSSKDREWVASFLLPRLERVGLKVCIDYRDFYIGVAAVENMARAVEGSRKVIIVLTPEWVQSEWTAFESILSQTVDPAGANRKTIPLMLKDCLLPLRLRILTYSDFREASKWEIEVKRLIRGLSSA